MSASHPIADIIYFPVVDWVARQRIDAVCVLEIPSLVAVHELSECLGDLQLQMLPFGKWDDGLILVRHR